MYVFVILCCAVVDARVVKAPCQKLLTKNRYQVKHLGIPLAKEMNEGLELWCSGCRKLGHLL